MSDDVIKIILSKLDRIEDKQDKTMEKVAAFEALEREREKRCDYHNEQIALLETKINQIEAKQISQEVSNKTNNDWIARLISVGSMLYIFIKEWFLK